MTQISIVFGHVKAESAEGYLSQRVRLLHNAAERYFGHNEDRLQDVQLQHYVAAIQESFCNDTPPMAPAVDVSTIPGEAGEELRRRKVCMLAEVGRLFPLIDGEMVVSNEVSYLENDWHGFNSHAIILKQATNFALCYYIYNDLLADEKNMKLVVISKSPQPEELAPVAFVMGSNEIEWGELARKMSEGMAGLLPEPFDKIGTTIISLVWPGPDKAAEQWQKVYDALQAIVKKELAKERVESASLKVKGFISFLTLEYNPLRDSGHASKQTLQDALRDYDKAFFMDIVNVFEFSNTDNDYQFAAATLANFMTGACLHLGLNQERALQDFQVSDASQSGYAATVRALAQHYAAYAEDAAKALKKVRLEQISGVKSGSSVDCGSDASVGSCTSNYWFWFEDSNNNYKSPDYSYSLPQKNPPDSRGDAQRARDAYYNDISRQMDETLQKQVYEVTNNWRKLQANPIPIPKF